jgi:glycine cleavage system H protein
MSSERPTFLSYKRSRFSTQLPLDYSYSPSHAWLAARPDGRWRVGLTRFATRMLGDMVDHGFELQPDAPVDHGQIIGWVEGFKAISDVFCVVRGRFQGVNGLLRQKITTVNKDPYHAGWLYEAVGEPDPRCLDVHAYAHLLDKTIDKILDKQKTEDHS